MENTETKYMNLTCEKNGRKYAFYIPDNSPIGEAYDAAYEVLLKLLDISRDMAEKAKRVENPVQPEVVNPEIVEG